MILYSYLELGFFFEKATLIIIDETVIGLGFWELLGDRCNEMKPLSRNDSDRCNENMAEYVVVSSDSSRTQFLERLNFRNSFQYSQ